MSIKKARLDHAARNDHSCCTRLPGENFHTEECPVCGRLMLVSRALVFKCMGIGFFLGAFAGSAVMEWATS